MSSEIKQAVLPRELRNLTVGMMEEGEFGLASLDDLSFDHDGRVWLHRDAPVLTGDDEPGSRGVVVARTSVGYAVVLGSRQRVNYHEAGFGPVGRGCVPVVDVQVTSKDGPKGYVLP
ncbi:hypothetical protein [Nocardia flavorosea]|uniref:Uncharacterized protein n=1 Tax=Nocardia flavorosea TaxID=53429 RepID=A0A846YNU9_9NOCA|nr:hypothetical protein [Nocardia flavorosea]NKY60453.1 hypothetical protein [Nocardia flavorosea]